MFTAISLIVITLLLLERTQHIMATLQDLKDSIAAIATGVDRLEAQIADLKAQVAAGSPVTQADLDDLAATAAAINVDINDPSDQG